MARLIPATLPDGIVMSERNAFEAFSHLPDSWTVLWDVPVGMFGRPRADLRQIDILLLHERFGVIVVEVKGGAIKVEDGVWWTQPKGSSQWKQLQRSPFKQAADQRYTLQRYLCQRLRVDPNSFSHAVAFPGCDVASDLGPDAPRELAIDVTDLKNPTAALLRVRGHWGHSPPIAPHLIESIVADLKPSFTMTIMSSSVAAITTEALERETRRQVQMVDDQLAAYRTLLSTDRVAVLGGAGTGKTVVAAELARQMASTGSRTLMLCHRLGVQSFLNTLLGIRSTHRSFDGASTELLQVAAWSKMAEAVATHLGRASLSAFDPDLGEHFFEYRDSLPAPYDVIVVDEGQEFTESQIAALLWLLSDPDASPIYIFADPFQHSGIFSTALQDRHEKNISYKWRLPIEAQTVLLTTNCRNSSQIAQVAARFYPDVMPTPVINGQAPEFHQVPEVDVLVEAFRLASKLISEEGFRPNQLLMVIVGFSLKDAERAAVRARVSTIAVEKIYKFPLTPKDLRVAFGRPDDVQGLEADVTVIAYANGAMAAGTNREMYIATSRARSVLHVVSSLSQDEILALGVVANPTDAEAHQTGKEA